MKIANTFITTIFAFIILLFSCSDDPESSNDDLLVEIEFADLNENVDENIAEGTVIATFTVTVANSNSTPTLTIVEQTPGGAIRLDGNTVVVADASAFDYETNTQISGQVRATLNGVSETANFTFSINDLNEVEITLADITEQVNENISAGTEIVSLGATVINSDSDPTYTIVSQTPAGAVSLNGNVLEVADANAFDYETNTQITGQISVTADGVSITVDFTIAVIDIDETITGDDADAFITTWRTTSSNESITINTNADFSNYNYRVDWGDGTVSEGITATTTHEYANSGTYTVKITGDFPAIRNAANSDNAAKLQAIENWGIIEWESMSGAFNSCTNLVYNASDTPDLSRVENMLAMFSGASSFNGDIGDWDVSNVTDMRFVFRNTDTFNQDLNDWDVSNVTTMQGMFVNAISFNRSLNDWDVTNVTTMNGMFWGATSFNGNIGNWDLTNGPDLTLMFHDATSFNNGSINNWNVSNITLMEKMFWGATAFNQNLNGWNVGNVTNMKDMFWEATSFNGDISGWNLDSLINMEGMFNSATTFNVDISVWDVSNVVVMTRTFSGASSFNQNLSGWATDMVTFCTDFATGSALTNVNLPTQGCFAP